MNKKQTIITATLFLGLYFTVPMNSFAEQKFPDYATTYLGEDKYENFNRKMFDMNLKLNKYALRPIHVVWASIMPKYGMERIQGVYTNIQYPKRLLSNLIQKDFKGSKNETIRFITNSTIGLGGMFDPAHKLFKLEPREEGMEEALAKCNVKQGPYLVMPWLNSTTPRGMAGSLLDNVLNPSNYIGTPVVAMVKAGFTVNRTYYMQPLAKMIESTYADPYDIARKMYGLERHIKSFNLDRKEILDTSIELAQRTEEISIPNGNQNIDENNNEQLLERKTNSNNENERLERNNGIKNTPNFIDPFTIKDPGTHKINNTKSNNLKVNINLDNYSPQNPITDAMRTALFELPQTNKSIWSEFSIWNRSFANRIKTASVSIDPTKDDYKYRYILQKDKTAPVVIIYPSIGEGINSHHSVVMAKLFYDEGYSVIIQGSHFQWEFVKSMPDNYKPGLPARDADYLKMVTRKILDDMITKHKCEFSEKTVIGTSFGAMTSLFLADKESKNNTLDIDKYISINPPIELLYAMKQIDYTTEAWQKNPENLKERVAVTASKIIQMTGVGVNKGANKGVNKGHIEILPFTEEEAKLITGFVLHQKLSDLVFTLENTSKTDKTDIYKMVNSMNYEDYANKYLAENESQNIFEKSYETSLYSIREFLKNNNNYTIYHTMDDYLVNHQQLSTLKDYARDNLVLINNGSHLGFLYRDEFIAELKDNIKQGGNIVAQK